ncbi:MAG: hypothetical protein U0R18_21355 [Mycobacterium sp.]
MASMKRTRRAVAVGAFLLAAGAAPLVSALTETAVTPQAGQGQCLAWFGARDTGKCIGWANTSAPAWSVGTNGVYINPAQPGQSVLPPSHPGYGG